VKEAKKAVSIPIIASINCVTSKEWTSFAHDFEKAGADALELNLFVVPTDRKQSGADIEQLYIDVLAKVKKEVSIPVGVKIGFYFSNLINMIEKLMANGAASVTMFNRFYEPDINLEKLELSASEVFSSPAEMSRTLRWVGLVNSALPKLEIAASTGIHDGAAVAKQLLAGAQVTQLCSVVYIEGAQVLNGILADLEAFMEKWNFETIDAFRGRLSYAKLKDPMLYERAQFMKYFSSKN
jgi:dihydroorotate dehydrogenase (fumarate)